jgi:hypothetical protein
MHGANRFSVMTEKAPAASGAVEAKAVSTPYAPGSALYNHLT